METVYIFIALFAHILLPVLLLAWISNNKSKNLTFFFSLNLFTITYLIMLNRSGGAWYWFGGHWPKLFILAWFAALFLYYRKGQWKTASAFPKGKVFSFAGVALFIVISLYNIMSLPTLYGDFPPQKDTFSISSPLEGTNYVIVHGGKNMLQNNHVPIKAQQFGMDISRLNKYGMRAQGLYPNELNKYVVYGAQVIAPCDGKVIGVQNNLPDNSPPEFDLKNPEGNHILLNCGDVTIVMAHLQKGSVQVKIGQIVKATEPLGLVGNSGLTSEPHLHIHAVKGIQKDLKIIGETGEPVALLINNRFYTRNDIL